MIKNSFRLFRLALAHNKKQVLVNLVAAVSLELLSAFLLFVLNETYGKLYEGIQNYDTPVIWHNIACFTGLAFALVLVGGYLGFFVNRLAFSLRKGLTLFFFSRQHAFFNLPDNYPQRVQEDFRRFGETSCDFWFAILKALIHLPVFAGVLFTLTSWRVAAIVILAVVAGTAATRLVALRLVGEQSKQETNEAEFRRSLTTIDFAEIETRFWVINSLFKRLSFTQSGFGQAFALLPFVVLLPYYLAKTLTLGSFLQASRALGHIIDSLSVLIDSRQTIVNIETCLVRLEFLVPEKK